MSFDRNARNQPVTVTVAQRQEIFDRLSKHLDGAQNDPSVPGACRDGRYAVHCVDHDRGNKSLIRATTPKDAEQVAKAMMLDAMGWIEGVYDLDTLSGEGECLTEGDEILHGSMTYTIVEVQEDMVDGDIVIRYALKEGPNALSDYMVGFWDKRIDDDDIDPEDILIQQFEDNRLPVRYGVARVVVEVAFNTVAS